MKKRIKNFLTFFMILIFFISNTIIVNADSGLDSNYKENDSIVGSLISSLFSSFSSIGPILMQKPGSEDYTSCHIVISSICIIIFYIVTAVYFFKQDIRSSKKSIIKLLISLIPTIIFSVLCFITELQLILYFLLLIVYIIIFIIISKSIIKKNINKYIFEAKEIDKEFNEEDFYKEAFNIYKKVQIAWMNFEINKIKNLISEEMFNKYQEQLEELKSKNQKNIINQIEYKSTKIVDMKVENNIDIIKCQMSVICYDYIIDDKEKIIKGKKDKKYNYLYELVFNRNMKNNKYVLEKKKILKTKLI